MLKHDYHGYCTPAPVIKDRISTVEDVAGSLKVTYDLLTTLGASLEHTDTFLTKTIEAGVALEMDVIRPRLRELDTLIMAIDSRVKDDVILLYAVVDHEDREVRAGLQSPADKPGRTYTGFAGDALTMVHMVERSDGKVSDDRMNTLVEMASGEVSRLLPQTPATVEDLEQKIEAIAIMFKDCRWSDEAWAAVRRDMKALKL